MSLLQIIRILLVFHKSLSNPKLEAGCLRNFKIFIEFVKDILEGLPLLSTTS